MNNSILFLILIIVLLSSLAVAQPPDEINLKQANSLGFEISFEKTPADTCTDILIISPAKDPIQPKYEDLKVSLMMFKNDERVMTMSLKNRQIIKNYKILNENSACLPSSLFEEIYLHIIYEPKINKKTELECLKKTSESESLKCLTPFTCHPNWQINISNQIN